MELYINLKVNFRGNTKSFLLSGSEHKSWESMEATVKRSFGLCSLQLTYLDEENEEVSINSQLEYEEALKSAARQSNRLQMNVYESRSTTGRVPGPVPGPGLSQVKSGSLTEPKRGFRPPQHFPSLAQAVSRKVQAAALEEGLVRKPNLLFSLHTLIRGSHRFHGNRRPRRRGGIPVPAPLAGLSF